MKKELDAALNQKQVIEREYDNYMRSQELLYNQLYQRHKRMIEEVLPVLQAVHDRIFTNDNEN